MNKMIKKMIARSAPVIMLYLTQGAQEDKIYIVNELNISDKNNWKEKPEQTIFTIEKSSNMAKQTFKLKDNESIGINITNYTEQEPAQKELEMLDSESKSNMQLLMEWVFNIFKKSISKKKTENDMQVALIQQTEEEFIKEDSLTEDLETGKKVVGEGKNNNTEAVKVLENRHYKEIEVKKKETEKFEKSQEAKQYEEKQKNLAISEEENTEASKDSEIDYFWANSDLDGTMITKIITKKEYINLRKEARVRAMEEQTALNFIYNIYNGIKKIKYSIFLLGASYILNFAIKSTQRVFFSNKFLGGIPVVSICLPLVALTSSIMAKKHRIREGVVLSVLVVLAVYQIRLINLENNYNLSMFIAINWPTVAAIAAVLYLFSTEYAAISWHSQEFPAHRRKKSAQAASIIIVICLVLLSAIAYMHAVDTMKVLDTMKALDINSIIFLIFFKTIKNNIIKACIVVMSFSVSIMALNMRQLMAEEKPKLRRNTTATKIAEMLVGLGQAIMLSMIVVDKRINKQAAMFLGIGMFFTGINVLFMNAYQLLPANSLFKRYKNAISVANLVISAKVLLFISIYLIIKKLEKKERYWKPLRR